MDSEDFNQLIDAFIAETQEFLQSMEADLLIIEDSSTVEERQQAVKRLFRAAHSVKGSALMFGFENLSTAAHALEDCFAMVRDRADLSALDSSSITALLQGVDRLKSLADRVCQQASQEGISTIGGAIQPSGYLEPETEEILQIKTELETLYGKPSPPPPITAANSAVNLPIIQAVFEQDLVPVFNRLETELSQVQLDTLTQTITALNEIYYQLSAVAAMLQLPEFGQIVENLRTLIDLPEVNLEILTQQGWVIAQNLQTAKAQLLAGEAVTAVALNLAAVESPPVEVVVVPEISNDSQAETTVEQNTPEEFAPPKPDSLEASILNSLIVAEPKPESSNADQTHSLKSTLVETLPAATAAAPAVATTGWQRPSIRVDLERLTELVNLVGELVINRTNLELQSTQLRSEVKRIRKSIGELNQFGGELREEYDRLTVLDFRASRVQVEIQHSETLTEQRFDTLELDQYTEFHTTALSVIEATQSIAQSANKVDDLGQNLERSTDQLRRITDQLRSRVMQLRVVPFSRAVDHLPRALRDLCRLYNKQVNLLLVGRDTKIDETLIDALRDPLVHLLRNAFDHGIEPPEVRKQLGKPAIGQIEIEAHHQGGQTIIVITDDGKGIDPEAIRRRIVENNLVTPEQANELPISELYEFLFWSGFSTKGEVTDLSGRGVGLDVVRNNLRQVRGTVKVDSKPGKGTSFILKLPLMLSISEALMVRVDRSTVAIPLDAVEEILHIQAHQIQTAGTQPMLRWRNEFIRLVRLQDILEESTPHPDGPSPDPMSQESMPIMVLTSNEGVLAIAVERLLGQQEIVVKALPLPLSKPRGIVGCTILGNGEVVTIVDVDDLIGQFYNQGGTVIAVDRKASMGAVNSPAVGSTSSAFQPRILVVDDSYTIRQLLSMTLTRARYRVTQAKDGQDALAKLEEGGGCDLIISDIEMPRMDGFELLRNLKAHPKLAHIPVAMLTSRTGFKHRQMALELGAKQYFTKPYSEAQLLEAILQLLTPQPVL